MTARNLVWIFLKADIFGARHQRIGKYTTLDLQSTSAQRLSFVKVNISTSKYEYTRLQCYLYINAYKIPRAQF